VATVATVDVVGVRTCVPSRLHRRRLGWILSAVVGALIVLAFPSAVVAQDGGNSLQSIDPPNGASLGASPEIITLSFNQELADDDVLSLQLSCNNQPQDTGLPDVDDDALIVTVAVSNPLPRGSCVISWRLVDGLGEEIVADTSTFAVTSESAVSTVAGATTTTDPFLRQPAVTTSTATESGGSDDGSSGGALWLGRLLSTIGILVVFGGLTLISVGWPEGPEYVVTVRFFRTVWFVSLLGTILYLVAFAADFNDTSFGAALSPSAWLDLNDAGWAGRGALLRLVFVAASGAVAMRPERIIDPATAMWAWAIPGTAVITVAMSRVGAPAAILGFLVGVVHVFAVAIWVGGAALVARVVLAGPGDEDLVQATRAFSRISVPAMLVAAATGVFQVFRLDGGDLFSSSHGRVLLLKVVAVAAMLAVSLAARQQVTMRLDRAHEMSSASADRFRRAFSAEATLGIVVLAFSGWMLALTPPNVDPHAGESYSRELPIVDPSTGLEATVFIGPSVVGRNGLRVEVEQPADGITNLTLRFLPPPNSNVFGLVQSIPLSGAGTAVLPESDGLPFGAAGTWTLEFSTSTAIGVQDGATGGTFSVLNADGSTVTVPAPTNVPVDTTIIDQATTSASFATTTTTLPPTTTVASG